MTRNEIKENLDNSNIIEFDGNVNYFKGRLNQWYQSIDNTRHVRIGKDSIVNQILYNIRNGNTVIMKRDGEEDIEIT